MQINKKILYVSFWGIIKTRARRASYSGRINYSWEEKSFLIVTFLKTPLWV
jgi:hypothetical protein